MSRNIFDRIGSFFKPAPARVYVRPQQHTQPHADAPHNLSRRQQKQHAASMAVDPHQGVAVAQGVQSLKMRPLTDAAHRLAGTKIDINVDAKNPATPEKKWHEKLWGVFGIDTNNNDLIHSTFQNRPLSAMTQQQAHAAFVNGAAKNVHFNDEAGVYRQGGSYCSMASATNMMAQIKKNIPAKIENTKKMIAAIKGLIAQGESQTAAIGNVFSRLIEGVYYMGQHGLLALGGQEGANALLHLCNEIARNPKQEISVDDIEIFMQKLETHLNAAKDTFNQSDFDPKAIALETIIRGIELETESTDQNILASKLGEMCTGDAESSVGKINRLMEPETPIHQGGLFMSNLLLSKNNRCLLNQLLTLSCTKPEALNDAMDAWLQMKGENMPTVLGMLVSNDAASAYLTNNSILSDEQKKDIKISMIAFIEDFKANGIQINAGSHYTALVYQEENNCIARINSLGKYPVSTYHANASPNQLPIVDSESSVDIWTRLNLPIAEDDHDYAQTESSPRTNLIRGRHMMAAALSSQVFRGIYR